MELDPSHEQINGPLTPSSPDMDNKSSEELRMNVDGEDNKVKFTPVAGGTRELTSHEQDSDESHHEHEKILSADDRTSSISGFATNFRR
jgi:hypothetical protein